MSIFLGNTQINWVSLWTGAINNIKLWAVDILWETPAPVTNWLLNWLVSYWKADTNWSFPDVHWTNDWTLSWVSYTASWKIGWAYTSDWVNDKIDCWSDTSLSVTSGDATWSLWINNITTPAANRVLFCRMKNADLKWYYLYFGTWNLTFISFHWDEASVICSLSLLSEKPL